MNSLITANALIPQFPSLPIQSRQSFIKSTDLIHAIESINDDLLIYKKNNHEVYFLLMRNCLILPN